MSLDKESFVMCCVDYCNAVCAMSPQTVTNRLQRVMNAAARIVTLGNSVMGWRQFYTTSSIGWTFPRRLSTSSVWWCTGVCTDRHLATSLNTSSKPLMLLLTAAVYDLPTVTVSLCLAVDSAHTAVVLSTMSARQSGTRCLMNLEILTVLIALNGSWKQFALAATSVSSALEVIFIMRRAI